MTTRVYLMLTWLIILIWIQQSSCDDAYAVNKWTCKCSAPYQGNASFIHEANCSASCDCTPDAESSGSLWTCMCSSDGFPRVTNRSDEYTCFTACNCSTAGGLPNVAPTSKKQISTKEIVIILLLCVVITALAFLASVLCYLSRREKFSIQSSALSANGQTSFNSYGNLFSHKSSSILEMRTTAGSPPHRGAGCFYIASRLLKTKPCTTFGTIIQFSFSELEDSTDKISSSNLVGRGGSSFVYRDLLKDGSVVAVKRLKTQGGPDDDSLFLTEIELLSRLHHCHVVPLLGYCLESQGKRTEKLLVYEYMARGNLRDCLDRTTRENMNWASRLAIAIGAARGLEYLHEAAAPRILHRDVKSTNILLHEDWQAKITDLGMAKRLSTDGLPSCSNSPARMQGTFGYFAPEYAIIGRASLKSDVFSFGVVLLELITGQHPIKRSANKGEERLVIWATPRLLDSGRVIAELPDPHLKGVFPEEEMQIMAYLAKECLLLDPDERPTMSEVVQILSTIAPHKSRRRNIAANIGQGSFAESSPLSEQHLLTKTSSEDEMELQRTPSGRSPTWVPSNDDGSVCNENETGEEIASPENMGKSLLLRSTCRSWRASEDVILDLSEPQLESFCITNSRPLR